MESTLYEGIIELKKARSIEEANELLSRNWKVLYIGTIGELDLVSKQASTTLTFVLGKKLTFPQTTREENSQTSHYVEIPKITWTEKTSGFSWAFAANKDGSEIPEYKQFIQTLKEDSIQENGYKYTISKDGKFLQRTKTNSES